MKRILFPFALVVCGLLASLGFAEEGYFDSKGVKIRYVSEGEGEAVVLIHGWQADSSMWGRDKDGNTKLNASGTPGFRVIALDCRGHGKSDKPHDVKKYGTEMAMDVVRLLDHLKIKKAHLVGYSMGAFIAGKVAALRPDRVLSLIYGGQAPLLPGKKSKEPGEVEIFAKAVEEGKGMGSYLLAVMPAHLQKPTLEQANAYTEFMFRGKDLKALAASGLSFGRLEVKLDELKRCKAPTLYIYGSKEPDRLKERVELLRKELGGELKVIEGADHTTALANPAFGKAVVEFLKARKTPNP